MPGRQGVRQSSAGVRPIDLRKGQLASMRNLPAEREGVCDADQCWLRACLLPRHVREWCRIPFASRQGAAKDSAPELELSKPKRPRVLCISEYLEIR